MEARGGGGSGKQFSRQCRAGELKLRYLLSWANELPVAEVERLSKLVQDHCQQFAAVDSDVPTAPAGSGTDLRMLFPGKAPVVFPKRLVS